MKEKKFQSKGMAVFVLNEDYSYTFYIRDFDEIEIKMERHLDDIYDLIDGLEFLEDVKSKSIMDYDGEISEVFVDGYKSNLGLFYGNSFSQGNFLVNDKLWEEICKEHKVQVNWANK